MKKPWEYVYVIRPIEPIENCLRYADGKWIEDDGKPDLAFVGLDAKGIPIAVHVEIPYKNILWQWRSNQVWHCMFDDHVEKWLENRDSHPNVIAGEKAAEKCAELYGVANGIPVPIYMMNPWIEKGKLWRIEDDGRLTPVKPPEKIECTLCVKRLHQSWEKRRERKMTKVKCPWRECKYNRDGICTAEEIELAEEFAGGFYYLYCKAYKGALEAEEK